MASILLGLAVVLSLISFVANIIIVVAAFRESVLWGLGALCLCPVELYFIIEHWKETKGPFLVSLGTGILAQVLLVLSGASPLEPASPAPRVVAEAEPGTGAEPEAGSSAPYRPSPREEAAPALPPPPRRRPDAATAVITVQTGQPAERLRALGEWLDEGLHRVEGARRDMIRAAGPRAGPEADQLLARSLRDPITTREALDCVPAAPPATRRALLHRLTGRDPLVPSEEVARALNAVKDDPDAAIDETLIRIGHASEGCARRLILARGGDWTRTPDGKALLDLVPLPRQLDLIGAEELELRIIGMRLATTHGADVALETLSPLLADPSHVMRQEAVQHLDALRDPRAAAPLVRALVVEHDESTRARIKRALGALASGETAQAFIGMLDDASPQERLAAIAGIEATQPIPGIRALGKAVRDPDRAVALAAVKTLTQLHPSRAAGVKQAVEQLAQDLGRVATETRDAELKRLARKLYFDIRGRLPEQDRR